MNTTGAIKNEVSNDVVLEGRIPPIVIEVARAQNIKEGDIWGVYLSPDDPRNPNSGSHYLGMRNVSFSEFKNQVEVQLQNLSTVEAQPAWVESLRMLTALPEKTLETIKDEGLEAIKEHELTHKKQWDNYKYQTVLITAFERMTQVSLEKRAVILEYYQDLILLAEVQALSVQCSRETENPEEQRLFNIYWFSKTFSLLNEKDEQKYVPSSVSMDELSNLKVSYGSRDIEQLQSLFNSLSTHGDYSRSISNVNGLLSRTLYVCEDPAGTLKGIREGNIDYSEFRRTVVDGLERFYGGDTKDFMKRASDVKEGLEDYIRDTVDKLKEYLA